MKWWIDEAMKSSKSWDRTCPYAEVMKSGKSGDRTRPYAEVMNWWTDGMIRFCHQYSIGAKRQLQQGINTVPSILRYFTFLWENYTVTQDLIEFRLWNQYFRWL